MQYYRLAVKDIASARVRETTFAHGPLIVLASDEEAARRAAAVNFGMAVERIVGEQSPACVWSDYENSSCHEIDAPSPSELRGASLSCLCRPFVDLGEGRSAEIVFAGRS